MTAGTITGIESAASARRLHLQGWKQAHDQTKQRLLIASRSDGRAAAVRALADCADEWATVGGAFGPTDANAGAGRAMWEFGHMIAHDLEAERSSFLLTALFLLGCIPVAALLGWLAA